MGFLRRIRRVVRRVTRVVRNVSRAMDPTEWLRGARDLIVDPIINPNQDAMKAQANAMKEQNELAKKELEDANNKRAEEETALREAEKNKYDNVGSALGSLLDEEEQTLGVATKKKRSAL